MPHIQGRTEGGYWGVQHPKFTILHNIRKIRSYSEISMKL